MTCPASGERADTVISRDGGPAHFLLPAYSDIFPAIASLYILISPLRTSGVKKHKMSSLDPITGPQAPHPCILSDIKLLMGTSTLPDSLPSRPTPSAVSSDQVSTLCAASWL